MVRYVSCVAAILLAAANVRAGELDAEFTSKAPAVEKSTPAKSGDMAAREVKGVVKASELDDESPAQCWRRGWGGWGRGWGGGWGRGWAWGGGWGWGRGWGWAGNRGWGGWGWGYAGWPAYAYPGYVSFYYPGWCGYYW